MKTILTVASDAIWDGRADEAVESLEELLPSLQSAPELDEAVLLMGTALIYAGEPIRGRQYLETFLAKHPGDPKALELLEKTKLKRK